jgi:hypothetical protein|tara:strand:+ start:172 stop:480 length:309 start_codon:yes stop_codon:yes gene_type:complete
LRGGGGLVAHALLGRLLLPAGPCYFSVKSETQINTKPTFRRMTLIMATLYAGRFPYQQNSAPAKRPMAEGRRNQIQARINKTMSLGVKSNLTYYLHPSAAMS